MPSGLPEFALAEFPDSNKFLQHLIFHAHPEFSDLSLACHIEVSLMEQME